MSEKVCKAVTLQSYVQKKWIRLSAELTDIITQVSSWVSSLSSQAWTLPWNSVQQFLSESFQNRRYDILAGRAVTRQRRRDKQIYQNRYLVTPSKTKQGPTEILEVQ
jgi:hypothetical protein